MPSAANRIANDLVPTNCVSPDVESWPGASGPVGPCYSDSATSELVTYYYRVLGVAPDGTHGDPSGLAYGARSLYDRQVWLKADQVYGLGYWQPAIAKNLPVSSWLYRWDTLDRPGGTEDWTISARSFTQGIGSAPRNRTVETEGEAPVEPRDPLVTLTKTGPGTASAGDTITYLISYHNAGPAASSNAAVTDTLPPEVRFISASYGGTYDAGTRRVTWDLGDGPAGTNDTLRLDVRIRATTAVGTAIVNRADFTGELTVSPPTAVAETTVVP